MSQASSEGARCAGAVQFFNVAKGYGFIVSPSVPSDVFFHEAQFQDVPLPRPGEEVTFSLVEVGGRPQAHDVRRKDVPLDHPAGHSPSEVKPDAGGEAPEVRRRAPDELPIFLKDWAYIPFAMALEQLAAFSLPESWHFGSDVEDPKRPHPILFNYLVATYSRLAMERKIAFLADGSLAAFNTGLVDRRYRDIFAVFVANAPGWTQAWKWQTFCTEAEDRWGQELVRYFNPRPAAANYFDDPRDLLYDVRQGEPEVSWKHVLIERLERYPVQFIEPYCPRSLTWLEPSTLNESDKAEFYRALADALDHDSNMYRALISRVQDALEVCIKRVRWNYKTAIPLYYPRFNKLMLMLPLCLLHDERADLALVVERMPSARYLGRTVLPLDWAYKNARLICRPNSDWLLPDEIAESHLVEDQNEV